MDNKRISQVFEEIADMLEIQGAIIFRVNAYRKGALMISNLGTDLRDIVDKNPQELLKIPGIGADLQRKIVELVRTGKCEEYEKMKKKFPKGLLEMLSLRSVGPKKVKMFFDKLKITNIRELKDAAEKHKLMNLEGMGEKSEQEIMKAIDERSRFSLNRFLISEAMQEAEQLIAYMKKCSVVSKIEYAGSLRRMQETIGDLDILVTVRNYKKDREPVMAHFTKYRDIVQVIAEGDTKSTVMLESGMHADLRVVDNDSFGAALHYFTGSKDHNIRIRDLAKKKNLKVNEYGVFKGEKMVSGKEENDIFKAIGLPFIIPEIRRNDGEIEYALKHKKFPKFIELMDIKGDLHSHSIYSDGRNTIEEMAHAFIEKGYEYFGISDHSSVMTITGGVGSREIKEQWAEVDKLNKKLKGKIKILKGCEVDILKDGNLDFSDEILKKLDFVIISAHMYGHLPVKEQTERLIAAIEHPYSRILAHPTGRLINKRAAIEFDMEKVIDACVKNNVIIEINANPLRLDLAEKYVKIGLQKGALFVINTDSHSPDQTDFMKYGVGMARRGWLEKKHVINTCNFADLTALFKKI